MAVPTHREGCRTLMFQTSCHDCKQIVFIFSCTCESKVFFDKKGPPWPLHRDKCIPYLIHVLRDETDLSDKGILERLKDSAASRGLTIPPEVYEQLSDGSYPVHHKLQVLNIAVYDDSIIVEGNILDINLNINVYRRFSTSDGPMGNALLGSLATGPWSEVTLRQMHTELEHFAYQVTFLIPRDELATLRWKQGSHVATRIKGFLPVGRDRAWVWDRQE